MEAEHCQLKGCDEPFHTLNYTEIHSFPRKEWEIVMQIRPCPEEDMRFHRQIPVISNLLKLPVAKNARLTEAEVIAIVLYTGPMVRAMPAPSPPHPRLPLPHQQPSQLLLSAT